MKRGDDSDKGEPRWSQGVAAKLRLKETSDVSIAEGDRHGEVRHYGVITSDLEPLDKVRIISSESLPLRAAAAQALRHDRCARAVSREGTRTTQLGCD